MKTTHCIWAPVLAAALVGSPARAENWERDPSAWLRNIYGLYQQYENSESMADKANTKLVEARASKALAALFKKESDCVAHSDGDVCALDWDFVVDGQDAKLTKIKVGETQISGDKATVTVSFDNLGTARRNVYSFVREDGDWKVDDIETKSGADAPVRIHQLLKDYDYPK